MTQLIQPLAQDFTTIYRSPNPDTVYCYSPGIAVLLGGRLIATMDLGGSGVQGLEGVKGTRYGNIIQGKAFISDNGGKTWEHVTDFPFMMARPFVAGKRVYILGLAGDLMIMTSEDQGKTWQSPSKLTENEQWTQAPCNVHYDKGNVYLAMNRRPYSDIKVWPVSIEAPILMRGKTDADLTNRENWTFASQMVFRDVIKQDVLDYFGVPFYQTPEREAALVAPGRGCTPMGWLETNVVQIKDQNHYWYDPKGGTFHLWMRAHTGGTGYAAIVKVVEKKDGTMETMLETVPSGKKTVYVPCPGGQMKFHILYDEATHLYWLLSTQATDSMTRAECLPAERYNLPNNERQRLQLHFSKNCIDWCFAGLVAKGDSPKKSRHYASMAIDGDHLHILSRSGDQDALDAHQTNFISFHTIKDFRKLVY